jgi:hypothetical protein
MSASADQEEVPHLLAAIVRTEPGALRQQRLQAEAGAERGIQIVAEVERRRDFRDDEMLAQVRQDVGFQPSCDPLSVRLRFDPPILAAGEIGDWRQHVERIAAGRRERGIGRGRAMQIEAEILGERLADEDFV